MTEDFKMDRLIKLMRIAFASEYSWMLRATLK